MARRARKCTTHNSPLLYRSWSLYEAPLRIFFWSCKEEANKAAHTWIYETRVESRVGYYSNSQNIYKTLPAGARRNQRTQHAQFLPLVLCDRRTLTRSGKNCSCEDSREAAFQSVPWPNHNH